MGAAASAGGFDTATWQAIGRPKLAWFFLILAVPLMSVVYWLVVRPELRKAVSAAPPAERPSHDSGQQ
ncbi:MAG TPA: hypothetical protein VF486_13235 [Actinomycetes bacterium]